MLSQVIHCLSASWVVLTMMGAPQFMASAERLTATRSVPAAIDSDATIQTPWALSKTTKDRWPRGKGPPQIE